MNSFRVAISFIGAMALLTGSAAEAAEFSGRQNLSKVPTEPSLAQAPDPPEEIQPVPRFEEPPSRSPLPDRPPRLPPLEDLLEFPDPLEVPTPDPELTGDRICVTQFEVSGSTVFDADELSEIAADAVFPAASDCQIVGTQNQGYRLTFAQLQQARNAVTQYYLNRGFLTSGAFIPEQTLAAGIVQLRVIEGRVEDIEVQGLNRLNPAYVRDRIAQAGRSPLNTEQLLRGLQLLQLDPLIETIEVELSAGLRPGTNRLVAVVSESNPYLLAAGINNSRTPLVGSFQRRIQGGSLNLLGQGDRFLVDYANTDGSNSVNFSYTYPINARNGTLSFSHGRTSSRVIEGNFDILDIRSRSRYYELTYRQPLYQTPTQEFALSLTGSRQESESRFNPGGFGDQPFGVRGSDPQGRTRITALRFSQEWLSRDSQQVLALRSQFSLGVDVLGITLNPIPPDGNFFSWRGQGQWVYLFAPDTLLQIRSDLQLADRPLVPLEQIGIGGFASVRGYRQDQLLTDNGYTASAEVRLPIARFPEIEGVLQLIPFLDFGIGWNESGENPDPNTLLSTGIGLGWQMADEFSARLDYGIPLLDTPTGGDSWQESGVVFSIQYEPF